MDWDSRVWPDTKVQRVKNPICRLYLPHLGLHMENDFKEHYLLFNRVLVIDLVDVLKINKISLCWHNILKCL